VTDTPVAVARGRLSPLDQATLSALWLGLNFQSSALLPIVVPAQMLLLIDRGAIASSQQALAISALSLGAAVIAVLVTPLAGAVSDRMPSRRTMVVAGIIVALAGQAGLAATAPLLLFLAGFAVVQVGTNVATAAYQGLLPDVVGPGQRGAASGWLGLMTLLGSVGSLAAAGVLLGSVRSGPDLGPTVERGALLFYVVAAAVLVASAAVTVAGVRETRPVRRERARPWTWLWRNPAFRNVFLARGLVMIGLTLFLTYIEYYLAAVEGANAFVGATVAVALLALFGALTSALVLGIASDRVPRVPIVFAANLAMAAAAWVFVFAPAQFPLAPLAVLFGLGYGAYLSVDWALAIDSLSGGASSARDLGIFTVSINLPTLIAPALGGVVIVTAIALGLAAYSYRFVFMVAAVALVLGAVVVRRVRLP
jgi:MFS family permease